MTKFDKFTKDPALCVFAGSPKSGKSYMMKKILQSTKHPAFVFTGTPFNNAYSFLDKKRVSGNYTDNKLRAILRHQRDKKVPLVLVFDDMIGSSIKWNSRLINHMITCYRHYNLRILIATQYIHKIPPTIRESAKYAIIWRQHTANAIDAVRHSFLPQHKNNKETIALFKTLAKYEAILVNMEDNSTSKIKA